MISIHEALKNIANTTVASVLRYNRNNIVAGIVHIGVGNFHRTHEAWYTHNILNHANQQKWGICGISLLPGDETVARALQSQDGLYTLTECFSDGSFKSHIVGSIVDLVFAPQNPEKAIERLTDPSVKIVSLTITEGGYNTDKETGRFILTNSNIMHDISYPMQPQTVFGYVIRALSLRKAKGIGPFTVLSCDNLQHNGSVAKKAFVSYAKELDNNLADWIEKEVSFPNSMVDRITPATKPPDKERLNRLTGIDDAVPVFCEDFLQWVIEDNFCAGRPLWEKAGALFTNDVTPYERIKLYFLNASHTMLSYPAFLAGYRLVDDAIRNPVFYNYLNDFMNLDVTPVIIFPTDINAKNYKKIILNRFSNPALGDQLGRLCFDGASKLPVFLLPIISKMFDKEMDIKRMAFLIAAYGYYLQNNRDDKGMPYEVNEPWLSRDDWTKIHSGNVTDFLLIEPFKKTNIISFPEFVNTYIESRAHIKQKGIIGFLSEMIIR